MRISASVSFFGVDTDSDLVAVVFLGTLNAQLQICKYTNAGQFIGGQAGCYNLVPVFDWIHRCIISIFLVFMISFLPLFLQGVYCYLLFVACSNPAFL